MHTERELQLYKELELMDEARDQYIRTKRRLDQLEDDALWQNRRSKELNDELFERYSQDKKLRQILTKREELLQKQIIEESSFFEECRENLHEMEKRAEQQIDDYREEIQRIQKETVREGERNEDNDNDYYTAARQKF